MTVTPLVAYTSSGLGLGHVDWFVYCEFEIDSV